MKLESSHNGSGWLNFLGKKFFSSFLLFGPVELKRGPIDLSMTLLTTNYEYTRIRIAA